MKRSGFRSVGGDPASSRQCIERGDRIVDYIDATRNEIAIDLRFWRVASGRKGGGPPPFPRPAKWLPFWHKHPSAVELLSSLFDKIWPLVGSAWALMQWTSLRVRLLTLPPESPPCASVALLFSDRTVNVLGSIQASEAPPVLLEFPWVHRPNVSLPAHTIDARTLISAQDVNEALVDGLRAHREICIRPDFVKWRTQSYTAFAWFLARRVVDKLEGRLVVADHFDRWAVLADRSAGRRTKRLRALTLIQHGTLGALDGPARVDFNLPVRLGCVDTLHCYSEEQRALFEREILLPSPPGVRRIVHLFTPSIRLSDVAAGPPSLLVVGHPIYLEVHRATVRALHNLGAYRVFYKRHPLASSRAVTDDSLWQVVENEHTFPRVDVVLSYPSTLAEEYRASNVFVVSHALDPCVVVPTEVASTLDVHLRSALVCANEPARSR